MGSGDRAGSDDFAAARRLRPRIAQSRRGGFHRCDSLVRRGHSVHFTLFAIEDDFASVFGKAFLAAYDAEVERYRGRCRN
ncbi:hypothetical protein WS70_27760 [Burkholderia mayonis]|uniref:Uncharacterized protein n=1 Tax=Burkholderia mayonis TaxID=1385591 RepID=A0A1B4FP81_9BURK|nr:hypothetical protein WS70_27760 [Burkholderia mayonis]KVE41032.1 hypothetical protein WS69_05685 [Burkholderia sp. BDU5]KVE47810.1 hypothetical protein WS70_25000 [Burkholderia mayonis]